MVGYENRNLPLSHNREGLVGDHFDHQPDNRNALLCKSGGSHFGDHHISVTAKGGCLSTTEQWERENQDTLMEYFIDGIPVCAESNVNTAARSSTPRPGNTRKYCSFQTCGHKMLNLRKSLKKRVERGKYTCACCGKQFLPIRADARYCSNACRQKDYRHRKTAAHTSLLGT